MNGYPDVFISYHRRDGNAMAQLIEVMLKARGYSVFLDYHSIEKGDFDEQIMDQILNTSDFILILSPTALDRCNEPDNWLRREITQALTNAVNVIPVFMEGFEWPANMPWEITAIKRRQGVNFNFEYSEASVERICSFMKAKAGAAPRAEERKPQAPGVRAGDTLLFGRYPQDAAGKEQPIEWRVLAVEAGRALLISEYALDCKPYNAKKEKIGWAEATLRIWLNREFYNQAFNEEEKRRIVHAAVRIDPESEFDTVTTASDDVFLLSREEAEKYFADDAARVCAPTRFAAGHGAVQYQMHSAHGVGTCWWWLRSRGDDGCSAASVYGGGSADGSNEVDHIFLGVRPAIWLKTE